MPYSDDFWYTSHTQFQKKEVNALLNRITREREQKLNSRHDFEIVSRKEPIQLLIMINNQVY